MAGFSPEEPCVPLSRVRWTLEEPLIDPRWRTETVLALAWSIQTERAFDRLPILADALEEAGCDNQFVLLHCRAPNQHIPHCWVISAVLRTPGRQPQVIPQRATSPEQSEASHPPQPPQRWTTKVMNADTESVVIGVARGCLMLILAMWLAVVFGAVVSFLQGPVPR